MSYDREQGADIRTLGLLLVLFLLILLVLWLLQFLAPASGECPPEASACTIGPCGCCAKDGFGNLIPYCDVKSCGQGYILNSRGQCCSINDLSRCISMQDVCVTPPVCNDQNPCCPGYSCNASGSCMPCSEKALCDPLNINSCCSGFACNANGRCEPIVSCSMKECATKGEACKVCDASGNCAECQDRSTCVRSDRLGRNVCLPQGDCPDGYHINEDTASRCRCVSNIDNSCPECTGSSCFAQNLGRNCNLCDKSGKCTECINQICASFEGSYSCLDKGKCVNGYECAKCASGCCNADGTCAGEQVCIGSLKPCGTCPSGCCNADGTCPACTTTCDASKAGQACSIYCEGDQCIPCDDKVCVNIIGGGPNVHECIPQGDAPYGYVQDSRCKYGIRNSITGKCLDVLDPNFVADPPEGYVCIQVNLTSPIGRQIRMFYCQGTNNNTCIRDPITYMCSWQPFTPQQFDNKKKCPLCPDWWVFNFSTPPEICLDCIEECNTNGAAYDLNGDGHLDALDIAVFDKYIASRQPYDRRYDFNNDKKVDDADRTCLATVCAEGGCSVIDLSSVQMCISIMAYPPEARAALGEQVHNTVSAPFDFGDYASRYPQYSAMFNVLSDEIASEIGTGTSGVGGGLAPQINLAVERGMPYIYGSNVSIEKKYFSGCVSFANPMGNSLQVMQLKRASGCSPALEPVITTDFNSLLSNSAKRAFQQCAMGRCTYDRAYVELMCKLAAPGKCDEYKYGEECKAELNNTCTQFAQVVYENCHAKYATFKDWCGSRAYEQCTTDESRNAWCASLINSTTQKCLGMASQLTLKAQPLWKELCPTISSFENRPCIESFKECYTDMTAFSNLVKVLVRDDAVKLLDSGTGAASMLTSTSVTTLPVVSGGTCPFG